MEKAYEFILNDLNLKYDEPVVVAVSGGADSMSLLHLLVRVKKVLNIKVVCAHVNHNVRKESADEKIFVEKFCNENGVIFEYMKIENYGDDNFHNEARNIRYNFFKELISKYKSRYLFTAHHGDDLIETILMRIVRGSTLKGYSGFSKISKTSEHIVVRPLNFKDVYTRNRYRKYIVPQLKNEDSNVHNKFYKFSATLLEYNEYIDKQVSKISKKIIEQNILNVEEFLKLDKIIAMKIIYNMLENIYQEDLLLLTDHHAELVYELLKSGKSNGYIHLPNNIRAIKSYNSFTILPIKTKPSDYEIEMIDFVNLPNGKNITKIGESNIDDNNICRLSSSDVKLPLHVRNRKNGDKICVKGMLGSKKVKEIFIDSKINQEDRDLWPIVVDSAENIVWIPGLKKSKFNKTKTQNCDIILRYY